jgi:peptidoglycan/xylan/chitin deacetylase (PgdA/CDA1 family)
MAPALVSITFDDGLRCQFEQAVPILDQYKFPATFFLVANTDPIFTDGHQHPPWNKTDWSEKDILYFKKMIDRGHEIGSHSVTHKLDFLDKDPKSEAEVSKRWIEDRLGVEIPSFCYPFYRKREPIKSAVINAGYKQARSGAGNSYISQDFSDWFNVDCRQISTSENVKSWIQPGRWHVLAFHGIGNLQDGWSPISVTEFGRHMAELATLRDSGAVQVATFKDVADRLRNASAAQSSPPSSP